MNYLIGSLCVFLAACASTTDRAYRVPATTPPGVQISKADLAECPYLTFIRETETFPESRWNRTSIDIKVYRAIEHAFAEGLKAAGFRQVSALEEKTSAFQLGAALATHQRGVVHGTVTLRPSSRTHRDFIFAQLDDAFEIPQQPYAGMQVVIQIRIEDDSLVDSEREDFENYARQTGPQAWEDSSEVIVALCQWRNRLADEGLAVEDLREQLVREMVEVRKRARQRKELELKLEEEE